MRWTILPIFMLLVACAPAQQPAAPASAPASAPPSAPQTPSLVPAAAPPAAAPPAAQAGKQLAIPPGAVVLACTPIEDRPPPNGQQSLAQPFSILLDRNDRPIAFVGGSLPAKIPYQVASIDPASGPANVRVGAIVRYAAKDAQHEMHTELAIMRDGSYRLGLVLKTPTESTGGAVAIGHGTCVSKPA